MSPTLYLSPLQVSEALCVSVTTVKRWVDDGVMPAQKTPGGHRKLLLADVIRFLRENPLPGADMSRLCLRCPEDAVPDADDVRRQLLPMLRTADVDGARGLLETAYRAGLGMEVLADEVIAPAMHTIGHDWATGQIDVYQEHQSTQVCVEAIHQFKAVMDDNAEPRRPIAICGASEGDPYLLASLLVQMVLRDHGWQAINFGPNTPLESFGRAIVDCRPRLICLSVSYLPDRDRFVREYHELFRQARAADVAVAVGGAMLADQSFREALPFTHHGDRLAHLVEFARQLHPRPRRPRRGRPRRASS
jgi:excisionase family DNA binding protein